MPANVILNPNAFECNNDPLTTDKPPVNDISTLDDHDLEQLLFACTVGGHLGRAAQHYYNTYIAQSDAAREHAIRILARMEARQTGAA